MSCPFGHKELEKFAFDITKADRIFDFLLQEGQIKLSPNHVIPSAEELKKMKYCKWHNATSHSTNECKLFRQQLQSAIESGRIKFDSSKAQKPMKIDQHPFPTNSGIGIKITGTAHFSSTVGSKTSSYPLLGTTLSAMVMIGMIDLIGSIRTMIAVLMGRLGEEPQFMIGWGAGSVCMTGLVTVSGIFPETKKTLKR